MLSNRYYIPAAAIGLGLTAVGAAILKQQRSKEPTTSNGTITNGVSNGNHSSEHSTVFTVFTINDNYELEATEGYGGLGELATLLKNQRKTATNHITTVNGDFLVATSLSNITKGAHMVEIFNTMEIDYVVLGNHEFDFGPEETKKRIKESNFEWLGTNVFEGPTHPSFEPDSKSNLGGKIFDGCVSTKIHYVDGFKIGIFGICTHETVHLSYPGDTIFAPVVETSQRAVDYLQAQGAEVIIAVTHQSMYEDKLLAKRVKGINLIIGGHDHTPFTQFEGETLIHKSGQNAQYLGRIDLHLSRNSSKNNALQVHLSWSLILNRGIPKDSQVKSIIDSYMAQLEALKFKTCGKTLTTLESRTYMVRSRESTMGNVLTDAIKEYYGTEIVIIQGGSIRGDSCYEAGTTITYRDVNREFPFPNSIATYKLKGSDLRQALEEGIRNLPACNGCFPQVSGIKMTIDINKEANSRIQDITINNEPLDPERYYTISSTEFIRSGGDGYKSLTKGELIENPHSGVKVDTIFIHYLDAHKEIAPKLEGRIVILE